MKFKNYKKHQNNQGSNRDTKWMNLIEGSNRIRPVTEFKSYGQHFSQSENRSYACIGEDECPFCQDGNDPTAKYLGWIIDKGEEKERFKLLKIGWSIFSQMGDFADTEGYEFDVIPDYDFIIKRSGKGRNTSYGVVVGKTEEKLTDKQKERIEELEDPNNIIDNMKEKTRDLVRKSAQSEQ